MRTFLRWIGSWLYVIWISIFPSEEDEGGPGNRASEEEGRAR